jgi:hypothetical protein
VQDALEPRSPRSPASVERDRAGSTDRGVHARAQVVHFDTEAKRPSSAWVRGVNALLPDAVAVLWSHEVSDDFHARYSARARTYRYRAAQPPVRPALEARYVGWFHLPLDVEKMREAAALFVGEHDFSAFRSSECQAKTPVRTCTRSTSSARRAHRLRRPRQRLPAPHGAQHRRHAGLRRQGQASARVGEGSARSKDRARRRRPSARGLVPGEGRVRGQVGTSAVRTRIKICGITRPADARAAARRRGRDRPGVLSAEPALPLDRARGGAQIYLKREDLNHTGAHKINNVLGQALLARRMGKPRVIAETGAGQHGVATATVARASAWNASSTWARSTSSGRRRTCSA